MATSSRTLPQRHTAEKIGSPGVTAIALKLDYLAGNGQRRQSFQSVATRTAGIEDPSLDAPDRLTLLFFQDHSNSKHAALQNDRVQEFGFYVAIISGNAVQRGVS